MRRRTRSWSAGPGARAGDERPRPGTSPNPLVGAIVAERRPRGRRGMARGPGDGPCRGGRAARPPASAARGATLVCTLEPCSHHGRTPPCTDALIARRRRAGRHRLPGSPGARARARGADPGRRPGSTSRWPRPRSRGVPRAQRGVPHPGGDGPSAGHAQARHEPRRQGRDRDGGDPVDQRARVARARPPLAGRHATPSPWASARPWRTIPCSPPATWTAPARQPAARGLRPARPAAARLQARRAARPRRPGHRRGRPRCAAGAGRARSSDAGVEVIELAAAGDPPIAVGGALEALGEREIQSLLRRGRRRSSPRRSSAPDAVDRVAWFVAPHPDRRRRGARGARRSRPRRRWRTCRGCRTSRSSGSATTCSSTGRLRPLAEQDGADVHRARRGGRDRRAPSSRASGGARAAGSARPGCCDGLAIGDSVARRRRLPDRRRASRRRLRVDAVAETLRRTALGGPVAGRPRQPRAGAARRATGWAAISCRATSTAPGPSPASPTRGRARRLRSPRRRSSCATSSRRAASRSTA